MCSYVETSSLFGNLFLFLCHTQIKTEFCVLQCVLAGIIVVALKGMLLQAKDFPNFWKLSKPDGVVWLITFLTVIFADIDYGLFVGLGLSLASIVVQAMKPYACLLGVMPRMDIYLDCKRYQEVRKNSINC